MEQVKGDLVYSDQTSSVQFVPGPSYYTWPDGYIINGEYDVAVSNRVLSSTGIQCVPYSAKMTGAILPAEWVDRTTTNWWSTSNIDTPYGDKLDYSFYLDEAGNPYYSDCFMYPRWMDNNESYHYWLNKNWGATAIRFTFSVSTPGSKLWIKFNYLDGNGNWHNSDAIIVESGVAIQLADVLTGYDHVDSFLIAASDNDPWDFYQQHTLSQMSLTAIEFLLPGSLYGWTDITDIDYWQPTNGYGTWDATNKVWSGEGVDSPGWYEVWVTADGLWNAAFRPTKIRVFYERDDKSTDNLPPLLVSNNNGDLLTEYSVGQTPYVSGTPIDLIYGVWTDGGDDVLANNINSIDLYDGNSDNGNSKPYTVTKIEVFHEIPKLLTHTRPDYPSDIFDGNIDHIIPGYSFYRDDTRGLYNIAQENGYVGDVSPVDTEWALEGQGFYDDNDNYFENPTGADFSIENKANLFFAAWEKACDANPPYYVDRKAICHFKTPDIYLEFYFTQWTRGGGGGFSYNRQRIEYVA